MVAFFYSTLFHLKTYNQTNFFKHTFCEFHQVDDFDFPENTTYKSKSESIYFYTNEGVFRKSNHWGRVANCRWKIIANENFKNQQIVIGFAKWIDFHPINSREKSYFIPAKTFSAVISCQHIIFVFPDFRTTILLRIEMG